MIKYTFKRLLAIIPVMLLLSFFTFIMIHIAPGGPFDTERKLPPEVMKNIEKKYHLDEPLLKQYLRYVGSALKGDLGPSFKFPGTTVSGIIRESFPKTMLLGICSLILALIIGITAGTIAAYYQNSIKDHISMSISMIGICIPNFVMAPLLVLIFALYLNILPVAGWGKASNLILPIFCLALPYAAYISRLQRGGMLEVLRQDYIQTARAKGMSEKRIVLIHAFKGGVLPVISFLGPALSGILVGSLVIETIFGIPGTGRFLVQSSLNRDYTMVMGMVLFYSIIILLLNLLVDIIYTFLDPRIRYE